MRKKNLTASNIRSVVRPERVSKDGLVVLLAFQVLEACCPTKPRYLSDLTQWSPTTVYTAVQEPALGNHRHCSRYRVNAMVVLH